MYLFAAFADWGAQDSFPAFLEHQRISCHTHRSMHSEQAWRQRHPLQQRWGVFARQRRGKAPVAAPWMPPPTALPRALVAVPKSPRVTKAGQPKVVVQN